METTEDLPMWYDDCNNKYSECYSGALDSNTFASNMLKAVPAIRPDGYYCYYFPESGCCKIEYYSSHS